MSDQNEVMTSINYLPRLDELGRTNANLVQINSSRSVGIVSDSTTMKTDNFLAGVIDLSFSVADRKLVSMSDSYCRAEVEITVKETRTGQTTPVGEYRHPKMTDNFTLAEQFCNNALASSYFYIGSQSVCQQSQYHGAAAALRVRLNKSFCWLQSIGRSVYWLSPDFTDRQKRICQDYDQLTYTYTELGYSSTATEHTMVIADGDPGESTIEFKTDDAAAHPLPLTAAVWSIGDIIVYTNLAITVTGTVNAVDGANNVITINFRDTQPSTLEMSDAVPTRTRDVQQGNEITDGRNTFQVCFQPPLACFSNNQAYPSGSYRLSLFPRSDKTAAFEYNTPTGAGNAPLTSLSLQFKNIYLFVNTFEADKPFENGTYYISYNSLDIQAKKLNAGVNSATTHTFNIPSSTLGIASFLADTAAGTSTALNCPPSIFKNRDRTSEDLTSLQMVYSNISKPVQLFSSKFSAVGAANPTNEMVQRYLDSQINANMDQIGGESYSNGWTVRGGLYYYSFIRPADDKSTNLQIQVNMANLVASTQLYIGSFYRKLVEIIVVDGVVNSVRSLAV